MRDVRTPTVEDAFHFIFRGLRKQVTGPSENYGYDLYIPNLMHAYVIDQAGRTDIYKAREHFPELSVPFYAAAWELCRRGILRPGVISFGKQASDEGGYSLTPFGMTWLEESAGRYDYVPTEPGRFAQMLQKLTPRFGQGFKERSQEAIRCYGANAFLACCAMCGAGAESIMLATAFAKVGDQAKVEKDYLSSGGRGRIEKLLVGQKPKRIQDEFKRDADLLKYWRDSASHGKAVGIDDNEAYTALVLLLRFAQFADDNWDELTN